MNVTVLFIALGAVILAILVMIQKLKTKPWIEKGPIELGPDNVASMRPEKIGLWAFLIVVASLFGLFISAYSIRMGLADWRPLPEPGVLWLNTALLVLGSIAFQWARSSVDRDEIGGVKLGLYAGGALSIAFLVGQYTAWQQLIASGYFLAANPANAFFYLITGLHALHLIGGLWVWGKTTSRIMRGVKLGEVRLSVELCTFYWHFLLLVWLVLFALLLST